jgi:hypothetical protein
MRGENGVAGVNGTRAFDDGDSVAASVGHGNQSVLIPSLRRGREIMPRSFQNLR